MKLLLDENLSFRLLQRISVAYPGSQHAEAVGLRGKDDREVWSFAATHGYAIVPKDNDFRQLSFLHDPAEGSVVVGGERRDRRDCRVVGA